MVLDDVYRPEARDSAPPAPSWESEFATPLDRMAAAAVDSAFFAPIATLAMAPFRREALVAQLTSDKYDWFMAAAGAMAAIVISAIACQFACVAIWGRTPGKRLFKLRVISIWTGQKPRPAQAWARAVAFALEACALGAPWLAIFSDERRRPLHDRASDCAVIADAPARAASRPSPAESAAAAGIFAALCAIAALLVSGAAKDGARFVRDSASVAKDADDRGLLCAEAGEFRDEWPDKLRPSRLEAALALAATGEINSSCLDKEADREAWKNFGGRGLAYAAKAVAKQDDAEEAAAYARKACAVDGLAGESCAIARLAAASGDDGDQSEIAAADAALFERASGPRETVPVHALAFAIRRRLDMQDFSSALALMENAPLRRGWASFMARERGRALWALERPSEARSAWSTALAWMGAGGRAETRRLACASELNKACDANAKRACAEMIADLRSRADDDADAAAIERPEDAVTLVRAAECAEGRRFAAGSIESLFANDEARAYLKTVVAAREGGAAGARAALFAASESSADENAYLFDLQSRLALVAANAKDVEGVFADWSAATATRDNRDSWKRAGLAVARRFLELGEPKRALAAAIALRDVDPFDADAARSLVVAAFRSGQKKAAADALASMEESSIAIAEGPDAHGRAPASLDEFDRVSRELRGGRRDARRAE